MQLSQSSLKSFLLRIFILAIVDVFAIQLAILLGTRLSVFLGAGIAIFTIVVNIIFFDDRFYAWRWISPALAGMLLLVVYPMFYSLTIAFTNRGHGHILTKPQVLEQFQSEYYQPADSVRYKTYVFARSESPKLEDFRFWLVDSDGKTYIASPSEEGLREIAVDDPAYTVRDAKGIPSALGEFIKVSPQRFSQRLQGLTIEAPPYQIRLTKLLLLDQAFEAQGLQRKYSYDPATNTLTNLQTGKVYHEERGTFVTGTGETREELTPGFEAFIGLDNILRVIRDENVRTPFWQVFLWTVAFALGTVVSQFSLGLLFALVLNGRDLPLRGLWRSILILPYAIPFWLSVVTWRGLLNPTYGPINVAIRSVTGISPQWFSDPSLAKLVILFVNMYLGFSYMMLVSLGALQSISSDYYEASLIDGANLWQQFRHITLPLILIAVGPLLIASFAFNFNNFTIIELINSGGPPMSAASGAGHTDILLSYTYRLAFSGARGVDYGFAAAISMFIFVVVGTLTFINFRLTGVLEKVSENV